MEPTVARFDSFEGPLGAGRQAHAELLSRLLTENAALKQQVQELRAYRALAYRDGLTGLRNRRYFDERLAEEADRGRRRADYAVSVVLVDLNDFKQVNDLLGHAQGDRTLCWVAAFLERNVRDHDLCCRTGGDEFALILPDLDATGAAALLERLRAALAEENSRRERPVGLSMGLATWGTDATSVERLLGVADAAMYRDKLRQRAGR